jgi:hypothetical protein
VSSSDGISDSASGDRWLSLLIGYTLEALLADRDRFETWSQITLDAIRDGKLG